MNKYYMSILAVAGCLALPMSALAVGTPLSIATSIGGTVAWAPSKSVALNVTSDAVAFCATALHAQGTEEYGLLSSDTKIYFSTITPAANQLPQTTTATSPLPAVKAGATAWLPK